MLIEQLSTSLANVSGNTALIRHVATWLVNLFPETLKLQDILSNDNGKTIPSY